jgi:NADH-quinone oxidoreductase subunit C
LLEAVAWIRTEDGGLFEQWIDGFGVDYPGRMKRFEVHYQWLSLEHNLRLWMVVDLAEDEAVPSLSSLYPAALWYEREIWDMYGILFEDHPDLRRILTDYGFDGHPLRKDFPLTGFVEVAYDATQERVVYQPLTLVQEFRAFDYASPWGGTSYVLPGDEKATPKGGA